MIFQRERMILVGFQSDGEMQDGTSLKKSLFGAASFLKDTPDPNDIRFIRTRWPVSASATTRRSALLGETSYRRLGKFCSTKAKPSSGGSWLVASYRAAGRETCFREKSVAFIKMRPHWRSPTSIPILFASIFVNCSFLTVCENKRRDIGQFVW